MSDSTTTPAAAHPVRLRRWATWLLPLLLTACSEPASDLVAPTPEAGPPPTPAAATTSSAPPTTAPGPAPAALVPDADCEQRLAVLERCAHAIETARPEAAARLRELDRAHRAKLTRLQPSGADADAVFQQQCREIATQSRQIARQLSECGAPEISGE